MPQNSRQRGVARELAPADKKDASSPALYKKATQEEELEAEQLQQALIQERNRQLLLAFERVQDCNAALFEKLQALRNPPPAPAARAKAPPSAPAPKPPTWRVGGTY